jgi:hypothetical protein
MLTVIRRILGYRISVAALIELALWLSVPYIIVGVVWTFMHPGQVEQFETALQSRVPAGVDLIAFGETVALWPVLMIATSLCRA